MNSIVCAECGGDFGIEGQLAPGAGVGVNGRVHRRCYYKLHKRMMTEAERTRLPPAPARRHHRAGRPRKAEPGRALLALDAVARLEETDAAAACRRMLRITRGVFAGSDARRAD